MFSLWLLLSINDIYRKCQLIGMKVDFTSCVTGYTAVINRPTPDHYEQSNDCNYPSSMQDIVKGQICLLTASQQHNSSRLRLITLETL